MAKTAQDVPSFSERAKELGLPVLVDRDFLAELGPIVWTGATSTQARNPQDGTMGEGLLVTVESENGDEYQSFVGNVALLKVLADKDEDTGAYIPRPIFPFRARIVKSGRTWVFVD